MFLLTILAISNILFGSVKSLILLASVTNLRSQKTFYESMC
jgi:hypothetical protein